MAPYFWMMEWNYIPRPVLRKVCNTSTKSLNFSTFDLTHQILPQPTLSSSHYTATRSIEIRQAVRWADNAMWTMRFTRSFGCDPIPVISRRLFPIWERNNTANLFSQSGGLGVLTPDCRDFLLFSLVNAAKLFVFFRSIDSCQFVKARRTGCYKGLIYRAIHHEMTWT